MTVYPEMKDFYRRAVTEILEIEEAREILDEEGIWYRGFKKGRGLIGALAAVGADLEDYTYELIAYRERQALGHATKHRSRICLGGGRSHLSSHMGYCGPR